MAGNPKARKAETDNSPSVPSVCLVSLRGDGRQFVRVTGEEAGSLRNSSSRGTSWPSAIGISRRRSRSAIRGACRLARSRRDADTLSPIWLSPAQDATNLQAAGRNDHEGPFKIVLDRALAVNRHAEGARTTSMRDYGYSVRAFMGCQRGADLASRARLIISAR